jgi:hypothetical protein
MAEDDAVEIARHAAEEHHGHHHEEPAEPEIPGHGHGHGHHAGHGGDTRIALLVTIIAALLAVTEIMGKGAQTEALVANVKINDLWAFYQAKSIRQTVVATAADAFEDLKAGQPPEIVAKMDARIELLRNRAEHYESDSKSNDGKKELEEQAKDQEGELAHHLAKYHTLEFASAAYELGIVLISISMMTKAKILVVLGTGLGVVGVILMLTGAIHPELLASFLP